MEKINKKINNRYKIVKTSIISYVTIKIWKQHMENNTNDKINNHTSRKISMDILYFNGASNSFNLVIIILKKIS